jgi:adenylosuccinate synthase
MPVTVVVGGQFGSEGKGKVAHYLAKEMDASVAIRCGGPNSGHTVIDPNGRPIIFQQLPTPCILPDVNIVLCAGSFIDIDILKKEIEIARLSPDRLWIDPNAVVITPEMKKTEQHAGLVDSIGSTGSGTGEAVIQRIQRRNPQILAESFSSLRPYIRETKGFVRSSLDNQERVIIEGTQGFGLSLLHSQHYPHVTSRDTTAAAFVSEAGLSPLDVDDIVLTIRAFPIRVAGNSGPFANEIDWKTVTEESGSNRPIVEYTSVSKNLRRVARFDSSIVRKAIISNEPSRVVLNHLDYVDAEKSSEKGISYRIKVFVKQVESSIGRNVNFLGIGPGSIIHNFSRRSFLAQNSCFLT